VIRLLSDLSLNFQAFEIAEMQLLKRVDQSIQADIVKAALDAGIPVASALQLHKLDDRFFFPFLSFFLSFFLSCSCSFVRYCLSLPLHHSCLTMPWCWSLAR
jgi:hypothetical protein